MRHCTEHTIRPRFRLEGSGGGGGGGDRHGWQITEATVVMRRGPWQTLLWSSAEIAPQVLLSSWSSSKAFRGM